MSIGRTRINMTVVRARRYCRINYGNAILPMRTTSHPNEYKFIYGNNISHVQGYNVTYCRTGNYISPTVLHSKARFIHLTPTSHRVSAAQIFTHTNIGPVHTPAFAADDLTLTSIRLVGVSIRRVQSSWTQATSRRQTLAIIQSQERIHGLISALSLPRSVIWGRSRLHQIVMAEM